ncbi:MAG TPA: 1-deoxy-D-xylulose-5-phosphate reductoisomerase [Dehalococcoidia bacterium]|nr:1-deoxy-D-xylulose-5-phosphate reductoisomerase [Dehalococcoidia bacterium]
MGSSVKRVAVLGSTGSIGRQTLEVIGALPQNFAVIGLAAGKNTALLAKQIEQFRPRFVHSQSKEAPSSEAEYELLSLEEIAGHPDVDTVVIATSGKWGLKPTLAAAKAGKRIALANKESLVMAGEIITSQAKRNRAQIIPVDSEHSALWQCLEGESRRVSRLIITASGGPFLGYSPAQLAEVTPEQALKHPSWRMGSKVTIDSATLMNKGLEVIEARWLFDTPFEDIQVIVHPQSIVHSMVEFIDGSVKAQLGYPDMRLPIQYALSYPERLDNPQLPRLDWESIRKLDFAPPDFDSFPCLKLAIEAGKKGGTYPAVLCAADEVAVQLFLSRRIKFTDIAHLVGKALEKHKSTAHPTLEEIMAADEWGREMVSGLVKELNK